MSAELISFPQHRTARPKLSGFQIGDLVVDGRTAIRGRIDLINFARCQARIVYAGIRRWFPISDLRHATFVMVEPGGRLCDTEPPA